MASLLAVTAVLSLIGAPVTQQTPTFPVPPMRLVATSLRDVATKLSKSAGVSVLVDRKVAQKTMDFETKGGNLDTILRSETNKLPKDVAVRTVLLPTPKKGVGYDADAVVAHIASLDNLAVGMNDAAPKVEDILYLGKVISREKALQLSSQTDLKFVYVFINTKNDSLSQLSDMQLEMLKKFMALSPEQQSALVDQQWDMMMNMDPATRKGFFQQAIQSSMGVMQKMQQMPPTQRQQFMDEIRGALPPGFGGPGLPPSP